VVSVSAYESLLEQQPASTVAGNVQAAARFVQAITTALHGDNLRGLSESQKNYLYKLRGKWEKRAAGQDAQWNAYGTRPGRRKSVSKDNSAQLDPTVYGAEDERDPLLSSLMAKYGTPRRTDGL
jgi:hypothetical protein